MNKSIKIVIKNCLRVVPDKFFLQFRYFVTFHKWLNLSDPKTFNEKLQWLKLNDRNPVYSQLVDKYAVRSFVSERIGEKYLIPVLGVWDRFEDIDFNQLPEEFVLKCTHDSGSVKICRDKKQIDHQDIKKHFAKALLDNQYYGGREWPYKDVKPRIIAEKYIEERNNCVPCDYKVMCFHGEPKLIQVHEGRFVYHSQDFYDTSWNKLPIKQGPPMSNTEKDRPIFLDNMIELSRILSADIPHIRVDWYCTNDQLYFGEMTFYDASGFAPFEPQRWDEIIGSWLKIKN